MSIDKQGNKFYVHCDYCCNVLPEDDGDWYDTFYDAVDGKKVNGWRAEKVNGEWFDKCPTCFSRR